MATKLTREEMAQIVSQQIADTLLDHQRIQFHFHSRVVDVEDLAYDFAQWLFTKFREDGNG